MTPDPLTDLLAKHGIAGYKYRTLPAEIRREVLAPVRADVESWAANNSISYPQVVKHVIAALDRALGIDV